MNLAGRIRDADLTSGERRVADLVLDDPSRLAFGSVASVATDAGVGNSTVMRFASRVGFAGFRELQDAARAEMGGRLRQATHRVRQPAAGDPVERAREIELTNVGETFARIDRSVADAAADGIARRRSRRGSRRRRRAGLRRTSPPSSAWCATASSPPTSARSP